VGSYQQGDLEMKTNGDSGFPGQRKLVLFLMGSFFLFSLMIGACGYLFFAGQKRALQEEKRRQLEAITQFKTDQITNWFDERQGDAKVIFNSPFLGRGIYEFLENKNTEENRKGIAKILTSYLEVYDYQAIFIFDPQGRVRFALPEGSEGMEVPDRKVAVEVMQRGAVFFSDLHRSVKSQKVSLDLFVPLFRGEGSEKKSVGMVLLKINPYRFLYPLVQSWPTPSRTEESLLVRREGNQVLFLNELRHRKNTAMTFRLPIGSNLPAALAVQGHRGTLEGVDYRGVPVLAAKREIPNTSWVMIAKIDQEELYGPLRQQAWIAGVVVASLILAVGLALGIYGRNHELRIQRERREAIQKEHKILEVTLRSIGDAVITTDLLGNVVLINSVAEGLTGWTQAEAAGRPLMEVFQIIHEQTRRPCENLVARVLKTGQIVGLANHTALISRDGTERIIADSGSPIRDSRGNIFGVVLVFRDETENRRKEYALQENEKKFRSLFDSMSEMVVLHELVRDGTGRIADYRVLDCNPAFTRITGISKEHAVGILASQLYGTAVPPYLDIYSQVAQTGQPFLFETFYAPLAKHFSISVFSNGPDLFATVTTDITARKQAEQERETTIKLLRLLNAPNDLHTLMQTMITFLYDWSGCEAVGIRLREGWDFPYFESRGFSEEFLRAENCLCTTDIEGQILRDEIGNPILECMCGNILCERFDPSKPFFTEHGSFWTNCTTELLAGTTEADRQSRTRNRCNGESYESVALIPLRMGDTTFGLVQLNDRRKGRFTPELIAQLERMCDSVAMAMAQRKTENSLRETEARLRLALNVGKIGIWDWDLTTGKIVWHGQYGEILGLAPGMSTTSYEEFEARVHPEDRETVKGALAYAMKEHTVNQCEFRVVRPDGSLHWVAGQGEAFYDAAGEPKRIVGVNTDINERKQAEETLRKSDDLIHSTLDSLSANIAILDGEGVIRYTNRAWEWFAMKNGFQDNPTMIGSNYLAFCDQGAAGADEGAAFAAEAGRGIRDVIEGRRKGFMLEYPCHSPEEHRWFVMRVTPFIGEGSIRAVIVHENVTERKLGAIALQGSEERFRGIYENSPFGIFHSTPEGKFLNINPALARILGYDSPAELVEFVNRSSIAQALYVDPDRRPVFVEEVRNAQGWRTFENQYRRKDGQIITGRLSFRSFFNPVAGRQELEGFVEDITERKQAEKALQGHQTQLQALVLELVLAEERERRRIAEEIHDNIGQSLSISLLKLATLKQGNHLNSFNDLLTDISSLVEKGIGDLRSMIFDLSSPVLYKMGLEEAIEEWLEEEIERKNKISYSLLKETPSQRLDDKMKVLLFRAIREVLVNVIKHARASHVDVRIVWRPDQFQIRVEDDGIGFDLKEKMPLPTRKGGFGLLSIRERLSYLGGSFEICSKPGQGTQAILTVPLSPVETPISGETL
jgi:PAS domain S-box-containing protein